MRLYWICAVLLGCNALQAQSAHPLLRKGDQAYKKEDWQQAEGLYRKSLEQQATPNGRFNLGNTVYRQERFPEAAEQFEKAAEKAPTLQKKAEAYYNLGNAYYQTQQYDKSVEAYKNALRYNPSDISSKYNLALAQKKQQEQTPPPPSSGDKQQKEQPQNQEQQQNQQGEQPQQPPNQNDSREPQRQPQQAGRGLSREEAEALLRIVEQEENRVQSKLRKNPGKAERTKKDW